MQDIQGSSEAQRILRPLFAQASFSRYSAQAQAQSNLPKTAQKPEKLKPMLALISSD